MSRGALSFCSAGLQCGELAGLYLLMIIARSGRGRAFGQLKAFLPGLFAGVDIG